MKSLVNFRTIIAALAIAGFLTCGTLAIILLSSPAAIQAGNPPVVAALTIIPAPTSTPMDLALTAAWQTSQPAVSPTPLQGEVAVGIYVQISGTGGDGLRLRPEPGLSGQPYSLGYETEIFQVVDGPRQLDNLTWWLLVSPYDANRTGWAVADYLSVISPP